MYIQVLGSTIYAIQTRLDIQHAVGVLSQFGTNPGKVHLEALKHCKSRRLSTSTNGVFPISQVPLDCPVCPVKPLFHPMSIRVDPNHFSAFPAFFSSFPITCPNPVLADQRLIRCAYSILVSFVIISLFPLPICISTDQ